MKGLTACFTAPKQEVVHLDFFDNTAVSPQQKKALAVKLDDLVRKHGIVRFICGMSSNLEMDCTEIALQIRERYPYIAVECVLACETMAQEWNEEKRDRFFSVVESCDYETLYQTSYTPDCRIGCDSYIMEQADSIVVACGSESSAKDESNRLSKLTGKRIFAISSEVNCA